jgi:hypothetical protein
MAGKRVKIELGDKVKYAKTRDGTEPHTNWVGEVVEIKSAEGEKYYRANFDPACILPEDHPLFYMTKGLWYKESLLQVVDNDTPAGFQK